jgi:hypothetical protein
MEEKIKPEKKKERKSEKEKGPRGSYSAQDRKPALAHYRLTPKGYSFFPFPDTDR